MGFKVPHRAFNLFLAWNIRGIADKDIAVQTRLDVGLQQAAGQKADTCLQSVPVLFRLPDCLFADVTGIHREIRFFQRQGNANGSRSGSHIKHSHLLLRKVLIIQPQHKCHQFLGFRPRDQDIGRNQEIIAIKRGIAQDIIQRLSAFHAMHTLQVFRLQILRHGFLHHHVQIDVMSPAYFIQQQTRCLVTMFLQPLSAFPEKVGITHQSASPASFACWSAVCRAVIRSSSRPSIIRSS